MLGFLEKYAIDDDVIAVGVSGGADSLALALQLHDCLLPLGRKIIALTVDHGLRTESASEAVYVRQLMSKFGIEHHTLVWEGDKPKTGIEEAARLARYGLLQQWCCAHNVRCLAIAHHALDQAETFLLRLQRGSGLNGLCGMAPVSCLNGLVILRPLLNVWPETLKAYLQARHIDWVEDSSNQCDDFLRVRIRKFLPLLQESIGITPQRLTDTMSVLARSRDYIEKQTDKFIREHVRFWGGDIPNALSCLNAQNVGVSVSLTQLENQHSEIIFRVFATLIKTISNADYIARAEDIDRLTNAVFGSPSFKGATLGHCEILVFQKKLWIVLELRLSKQMPKKLWDDFIKENPAYTRYILPYKLRVALVKTKMKVEF